jgi:hypothetical protein
VPKPYISVIVLLLAGLIFAFAGMLVQLTEAANIQVIAFRDLYSISDQVWGIWRAFIYLLVTAVASVIAIKYYRELSGQLNSRRIGGIFLFSICGLFFGLVVHYAKACCDSPVIFYFGFPLNWVRGITRSWHYLPNSAINYLIQNFYDLNWRIVPWNFFANVIFWLNLGFIFFVILKCKKDLLTTK